MQDWLYYHPDDMTPSLRTKWFVQAIASVSYAHARGVVHGDLQPRNFLVDKLELILCDFGNSMCGDIGIVREPFAGPGPGFYNPAFPIVASFDSDIFALGSVLYSIAAGRWPFQANEQPFSRPEEVVVYMKITRENFTKGQFPDVNRLFGGHIIHGCWTRAFKNATEIDHLAAELAFAIQNGHGAI